MWVTWAQSAVGLNTQSGPSSLPRWGSARGGELGQFYPSRPTGHRDSPPTADLQGWFVPNTCFPGAPAHPRAQVGAGLLAASAAGFIQQSEPPFWTSPEISPPNTPPGADWMPFVNHQSSDLPLKSGGLAGSQGTPSSSEPRADPRGEGVVGKDILKCLSFVVTSSPPKSGNPSFFWDLVSA